VRTDRAEYLEPYRRAAERHGGGFKSLLWASEETQAARFEAICGLVDVRGKRVLDVGCGRADFLDYVIERGSRPASYVGIEGVAELAAAAREKGHANATVVEADFVDEPHRMFVGADVVVISGALNTMGADAFYATVRRAYEAAGEALVFNFLCSTRLAGAAYLSWRPVGEVMAFAGTLSDRVQKLEDYLVGDCTVVMGKGTQPAR
jgi:cyclopropane fatty-acyl-phospholipid synthase-like methyltransferase